jgi:hypothetical protein
MSGQYNRSNSGVFFWVMLISLFWVSSLTLSQAITELREGWLAFGGLRLGIALGEIGLLGLFWSTGKYEPTARDTLWRHNDFAFALICFVYGIDFGMEYAKPSVTGQGETVIWYFVLWVLITLTGLTYLKTTLQHRAELQEAAQQAVADTEVDDG